MTRYFPLTLLLILLVSCSTRGPSTNKFDDDIFVRIADFQDRRLSDSLLQFLKYDNSKYRKAAALAFASIQDTAFVGLLGEIFLSDPDSSVQMAAAFALGQTGGRAFQILQSKYKDDFNDSETAEAIGRTRSEKEEIPANLTAWGLYRLALRGLADSTCVPRAIAYLQPTNDEDTRLGAAHFFARGPAEISNAESALLQVIRNDSSVLVRMAVALALRKIKSMSVQQALKERFQVESDYRVRINILRALQPYPLSETADIFFNALDDQNVNVAIASTEVLKQSATSSDFSLLVEKARVASNWRVKANLYEAALAATSHKELAEEIIKVCTRSSNDYEKAALIGSLSYSPMHYGFVKDHLLKSNVPVVRSSAAAALAGMNRHKLFEQGMQKSFIDIYRQALMLSDAAVIGTIAAVLADSVLGYKKIIQDFQFLYEARKKLTLPRDNESLQPLEAAIAYFEGREITTPVKNDFNHPIDWSRVKAIPHNQRVIIRTVKGDIEIELFVEEAPGSVANFLELAKSKYFDFKNFHRVVPNFVIQGGCNRGDGWGSEDYSIRSEFSRRRYKEGSVGMASAGKDTEGTQWFITHSPTPHLDGRYTIFGEVVRGMDVVHRMEVGDQIHSVELVKP